MLDRRQVEEEEEQLRERVNALSQDRRKAFYKEVRRELKDPDTYAALNWFFLAGLHHFYLGRWWRGAADLGLFVLGVLLIVGGYVLAGALVVLAVSLWELWALFRAQVIVQDWNNRIYRRLIEHHETGREFPASRGRRG